MIDWLWLGIGVLLGALVLWFVMSRQLAAGRGREEELEVALSKANDEATDFRRKANEGKTTIKGLRDSASAGDRAVAKLAAAETAQASALKEVEDRLNLRDRTILNLRAEVGEREETIDKLRDQLPKKREERAPKPVVREVVAAEASVTAAEASVSAAEASVSAATDDAAKAATSAAAAESQAGKATEKVTKLESELASSRETNRTLNQRATELKAAINRLEQKFQTRNRRIHDLEKELGSRDVVGTLVAAAPPEEGMEPDVEKLANEKLVLAYKKDMQSRDGRIAELRKQISQRDRKISQLLDADRAEGAHAEVSAPDATESTSEGTADAAAETPTAAVDETVAEAVEATTEVAVEEAVKAEEADMDSADVDADADTDAEIEATAEEPDAAAAESEAAAEAPAAVTEPEVTTEVEPVAADEPVTADEPVAAAASAAAAVDDLTRIKGVGPVFEGRLNAAGVYRFDALAALSPDRIRELVEAKDWQAASIPEWIVQARELANGG